MRNDIRTRVSKENYNLTRKLINHPDSTTFNDSLTCLLEQFSQITEDKK